MTVFTGDLSPSFGKTTSPNVSPDDNAQKKYCVLIAEDAEMFLKLIRKNIIEKQSERNYEIDLVNDGEQAIDKVKSKKYDLVILDNQMPKKTGLQALEEIRKNDPTVAIVFQSSDDVETLKRESEPYTVHHFMPKLTKLEQLDEAIKKVKGGVVSSEQNQSSHSPVVNKTEYKTICPRISLIAAVVLVAAVTVTAATAAYV